MARLPRYAVLGRGRWAGRMMDILAGEGRQPSQIAEARRLPGENDPDYRARLCASFRSAAADIAWLCIPPGPHVSLVLGAAIDAGLHVVAEKPWLCSRQQTAPLIAAAQVKNLVIGVHFEFCLLEAVESWRRDFNQGKDFQFGGHFTLSRSQRLAISPLEDLGSHLLSIRNFAVPQATVSEIRCGYDLPDERTVWLESRAGRVASINFLHHREPIIQRFIGRFEAALDNGEPFPFGLDFALQVADDLRALA